MAYHGYSVATLPGLPVADVSPTFTHIMLAILCTWVVLTVSACGDESGPIEEVKAPLERIGGASVQGTVTYRERLALTSGASLIIELRDVSYADAAAPLIASQTIEDPGQVPIKFKVEYDRDSIDPGRTYSIQARIMEPPDRLAFINDTAYEVITGGNPNRVDMLLVLVEPPPDLVGDGDQDRRKWVEVPARITDANLLPGEPEPYLRINFYQSTIEGCARRGNEEVAVDGGDIIARVTLMQPPDTPWAIPCDDEVVELDIVMRVPSDLMAGQAYRVIVNDRETSTFSLPPAEMGYTFIAQSPIESADLIPPSDSVGHQLRVVSGLPKGSACSRFNGYEKRRTDEDQIDVTITHHEVSDPMVVCTADYPTVETVVPLGDDFETGVEYTVRVNGDMVGEFLGR